MLMDQTVAIENRSDHCIPWCVTSNFLSHWDVLNFLRHVKHIVSIFYQRDNDVHIWYNSLLLFFSLWKDHVEQEKGTNQQCMRCLSSGWNSFDLAAGLFPSEGGGWEVEVIVPLLQCIGQFVFVFIFQWVCNHFLLFWCILMNYVSCFVLFCFVLHLPR